AAGSAMSRARMELCAAITDVVEELRTAHPTRTIVLRCLPASGVWDHDRLEQVFSNLVANALHYGSSEQPITVDSRQEGNTVVVDVHNHGVPIPEELQAKLF